MMIMRRTKALALKQRNSDNSILEVKTITLRLMSCITQDCIVLVNGGSGHKESEHCVAVLVVEITGKR